MPILNPWHGCHKISACCANCYMYRRDESIGKDASIEYIFVRSNRKTIGIQIKPDGSVILRAPARCSKAYAEQFLYEKQDWIEKARKRVLAKQKEAANVPAPKPFTAEELSEMKALAAKVIPGLVREVSSEMGVTYGRITIRAQKTRWGSCSSKGNLNFNCLLMKMPENVIRYVVVHELAHRRHMNHSKAFWNEVAKYQPSYKDDKIKLRAAGNELIKRLPK